MNTRRGFFKRLFGTAAASLIPIKLQSVAVEQHPYLLGYEGRTFYEQGIIYAPYIPIIKMPKIDRTFSVLNLK